MSYFLKPNIKRLNNNCIFKIYSNSDCLKNYDIHIYYDYAFHKKPLFKNIEEYIKYDSKVIIASTPNGKNHFYDLVKNSLLPNDHPDKNAFTTIQTYWYEVEGRDSKWKDEQIKIMGSLESFEQEYNLKFGKL